MYLPIIFIFNTSLVKYIFQLRSIFKHDFSYIKILPVIFCLQCGFSFVKIFQLFSIFNPAKVHLQTIMYFFKKLIWPPSSAVRGHVLNLECLKISFFNDGLCSPFANYICQFHSGRPYFARCTYILKTKPATWLIIASNYPDNKTAFDIRY